MTTSDPRRGGEDDVDRDADTALARPIGGAPDPDAPDTNSTTGATPSGEFVGRAAGQDAGYAGETGAERRAAAEGVDPLGRS